jgi:hypothetical protein
MGGPKQNPFLQLQQMNDGTMRRAYIITTKGIQLGVTASDLAAFRLVPLRKFPQDDPVYGWRQARGCVSIAGGGVVAANNVCGDVLMDTGVDRMYLSYAGTAPRFNPALRDGKVWFCNGSQSPCMVNGAGRASVTVRWPDAAKPVFSFTATAPRLFDPQGTSPIFANVWNGAKYPGDPTEHVFVNTSRQLLNEADYLYDATGGKVGFRKKK